MELISAPVKFAVIVAIFSTILHSVICQASAESNQNLPENRAHRLKQPRKYDRLDYPTLLDGTPRELVFYEGGTDVLYAECEAGLNWIFWRDDSDQYAVLKTSEPDLTIDVNAKSDRESGKRRSYLEWHNIGESGNLTCCKVKNNVVFECLRELHLEHRLNGKSTPTIIQSPVNEESRQSSPKPVVSDFTVVSNGVSIPTGSIVIWVCGGIVLVALVIGFGVYLHRSISPVSNHYEEVELGDMNGVGTSTSLRGTGDQS